MPEPIPLAKMQNVVMTVASTDIDNVENRLTADVLIANDEKSHDISRTDSLIRDFEIYKLYGIVYDAEKDAVYYNGEQVKLFVVFKSYKDTSMTYATTTEIPTALYIWRLSETVTARLLKFGSLKTK